MSAPSYHEVHVTTAEIPRAALFNLPYGYELTCNRVGGWTLWGPPQGQTQIASEYGAGLRIDVGGVVICDSLEPLSPPPGDSGSAATVA